MNCRKSRSEARMVFQINLQGDTTATGRYHVDTDVIARRKNGYVSEERLVEGTSKREMHQLLQKVRSFSAVPTRS